MPSWTTLVTWLIVGALAGSFTASLMGRNKSGRNRLANLGVGLAGALIGGALFRLFGIDLGLGDISVSAQDLVSAFAGSLILLAGMRLYRTRKA